ncbi:MAG: hypothetical protein A2V50_03075 [Bacteroidetes bacterium RBG_19FT_COMBO_42_10]|nr:MAG: hypothetical protein A2V50_03075 [Bacteroidetes bacterium RBG_19FT_COMBO_42_10]
MTRKGLENEFMDQIIENEDIIHKICNIYAPSFDERKDLKQKKKLRWFYITCIILLIAMLVLGVLKMLSLV